MAEPENKESTAEVKPVIDEAKLAAGIAEGLKATLTEMGRREDAPPIRVAAPPPPAIEDVSDGDIADAIDSGDKARIAQTFRKARNADRQRIEREALSPILSNGTAAFASVAKQLANSLPHYKKFQKEIDSEIERWQAANPNAVVTYEHYKAAHDIVRGRHVEDLEREAREAGIRQAREPESELMPANGRRMVADEPAEPTTISEVLVGNWKKELREKSRNRSDDEEMSVAGFGNTVGFIAARKNLAAIEEETYGSFGLDREWSRAENRWLTADESRRLPIREG